MVAKARKKLGKKLSEVPESVDDVPTASLQAPRFALSPRWQPPPAVEFFSIGHKSVSTAKTKPTSIKASSRAMMALDDPYDFDINEQQRSLESLERHVDVDRLDLDGPDNVSDDGEENDREERLNAECEVLRQRLEQRISASAVEQPASAGVAYSAGMDPCFRAGNSHMSIPCKSTFNNGTDSYQHNLLKMAGGLSAADVLSAYGATRFENSEAGALLRAWADEDERQEQHWQEGGMPADIE